LSQNSLENALGQPINTSYIPEAVAEKDGLGWAQPGESGKKVEGQGKQNGRAFTPLLPRDEEC
jgi:hypothetical protein